MAKTRHLSLKATEGNNGEDVKVRILDDGLVLDTGTDRIFLANDQWRVLVLAYISRTTLLPVR